MQDDDYLIVPEVLLTLHAAITHSRPDVPRTIHLFPAHEHLSTSLRALHTSLPPSSTLPALHTGFAWLGHGALLHRSEAVDFLALMRALHTSEAEMEMADNYYTVLGNRVPEVWFDQGIALGGGEPFTVGTEGDARNNRHIVGFFPHLTPLSLFPPPDLRFRLVESAMRFRTPRRKEFAVSALCGGQGGAISWFQWARLVIGGRAVSCLVSAGC